MLEAHMARLVGLGLYLLEQPQIIPLGFPDGFTDELNYGRLIFVSQLQQPTQIGKSLL